MSENKTFIDRQPIFMQLILLISLSLICGYIFTIGSLVLVKPLFGINGADILIEKAQNNPDSIKGSFNEINALKFIQLLLTIGSFLVPALLFSFIKKFRGDYLKIVTPVKLVFIGLSIFILLVSGPLVNLLYEWNQGLKLPGFLKSVEDWMKSAEAMATKETEILVVMPHLFDFIFNLFVIGIIPAIAEEFFFRGALQQLLREWFKNAHTAIWITAIIFSAFHFEFYGFVPRMILGAMLGYLFYWSGSLWVPIIGHLINNGSQVLMSYLFQQKLISYNIDSDEPIPAYITIISIVLLAGLMYVAYKNKVKEPEIAPELDSMDIPPENNTWP